MIADAGTCRDCREDYAVNQEYDAYMYAPYHYSRYGSGYCLACFLGVGPERTFSDRER